MPILGYFAVVAPVLLGLLCLAETVMGPPGAMPLTTSATGLPVAYVAPRTTPVLTVREGLVAEIPKGQDTGKDGTGKDGYALASAASTTAWATGLPFASTSRPEIMNGCITAVIDGGVNGAASTPAGAATPAIIKWRRVSEILSCFTGSSSLFWFDCRGDGDDRNHTPGCVRK